MNQIQVYKVFQDGSGGKTIVALFDEEHIDMDAKPDLYECYYCKKHITRDDVYFDNRCQPVCPSCLAEKCQRKNLNPRQG